ncbi:putative ribonuclease H-like domain-containing protein, partial [Tanacetum coccineum]
GKSDEGYLFGYSTSSKAFRVYNKRTKMVEENLHINFLEDQPNMTGTGPNWMFDLDFLTNSMNYIPVSIENQVNVDVEDVPPAAHEKPSESSTKENDVQDSEDAANKESKQDLQDELEKMVTQELTAKAMDDVSRQAFEEEKRKIASQKKASQATSTNTLSTDRPSVSTDRPFTISQEEPETISQALQDESWVETMQEELLQFKLQKVWVLVDLPYRKKVIGTKWVFRSKRDERSIVVKNKARLVA